MLTNQKKSIIIVTGETIMQLRLSKIYISNFKSIKSLMLDLGDKTVFFGENNSGKSNLLSAINLAFQYASISKDDVYVSKESPEIESKVVTIDLLFEATKEVKNLYDTEWLTVLGDSLSTQDGSTFFFAFRTELKFNSERLVFENTKQVIQEWLPDGRSVCSKQLNPNILNHFSCYYINANRDISDDLTDRKSLWTKLANNVVIPKEQEGEIQKQLDAVNSKIRKESPIISKIEKNLSESVPEKNINATISPLTKDLKTLYKGMSIYYYDKSTNLDLPVTNYGSGIKSWAVYSTVKSQLQIEQENISPLFSLILFEEPESHVHPQEQYRLAKELSQFSEQTFISTHSAYIVSRFKIEQLYHVIKEDGETRVFIPKKINLDEHEKLFLDDVFIKNGSLLFSKKVIFGEGITEYLSFPLYFEKHYSCKPFERGVDFISVGGGGNYKTYIKICYALNIQWFIVSDNDEQGIISSIQNAINEVYDTLGPTMFSERVLCVDPGLSYESYLYKNGYKDIYLSVIDRVKNSNNYLLGDFQREQLWTSYISKNPMVNSMTPDEKLFEAFNLFVKKGRIDGDHAKTRLIVPVAEEICSATENGSKLPQIMLDLFKKLNLE